MRIDNSDEKEMQISFNVSKIKTGFKSNAGFLRSESHVLTVRVREVTSCLCLDGMAPSTG